MRQRARAIFAPAPIKVHNIFAQTFKGDVGHYADVLFNAFDDEHEAP